MRITNLCFIAFALFAQATPTWSGTGDTDKASAEEVIAKVQEAANYLHDKGQAAYSDFNKNARWVWKDSYVFIYSCRDDRMIAHPLRPDLIGRPILQMEDDKGTRLFEKLCAASDKPNGGWVEYLWPKPGEGKASRKITYTLKTEVSFQPDVRVGAGIYDDSLSVEQLDALAKQAAEQKRGIP